MFNTPSSDSPHASAPVSEAGVSTALETGDVPIAGLAEIALREGNSSLPIYRAHRWFARRLGSQFRGVLTGLCLQQGATPAQFWESYASGVNLAGKVVLDPFLGGGTALVEARRLGARVIGVDIDPVAAAISRFELGAGQPTEGTDEMAALCQELGAFIGSYHQTIAEGEARDVLHHFWVEVSTCSQCGHQYDLHPHHQLAVDAAKKRQWVVCSVCDDVYELPLARKNVECSNGHLTRIDAGQFVDGNCLCPQCGFSEPHGQMGRSPPRYRLFAQEYLVGQGRNARRTFKRADAQDLWLYEQAAMKLGEFERRFGLAAPARGIPTEGRSSLRPLLHGITSYRQLFNDRQLLHLGVLKERLASVTSKTAREMLMLAFSEHLTTNCMYTAYAFGYRRTSPMFSIHGYRHIVRPVELNPWLDGTGRGTFPNVLGKLLKVKAYAKAPYVYAQKKEQGMVASGSSESYASAVATSPLAVVNGAANACVLNASSENLSTIPDASVDLCLTDPPYWDNVSYSELSDFYLAWHQHIGLASGKYTSLSRSAPIDASLASVKRRDEDKATYLARLTKVLEECRRVLKPNGKLVFTFHHVNAFAWLAVARALSASGFHCTGVIPLRGEGQGGLHSHEGTIKWDAVLTCVPASRVPEPLFVTPAQEQQVRRAVSDYRRRLGRSQAIRFAEPDATNLCRALLCAAALAPNNAGRGKPLEEVLYSKDRKQSGGQ
ncbi:MAG TPA: DNA methyltransferase [Candidatus Paceibacterota bacterium]|nr:DNA methyltransferase [Candidatus Paceibacterota bacterium]